MSTAHTPGPWFVSTADGSGDQLYVGGMVLQSPYTAFASRASTPSALGKIDKETLHANARLIAAAPDLLDALHRVMRHIPADAGGASLGDDMHRAHKALAKATGSALAQQPGHLNLTVQALDEHSITQLFESYRDQFAVALRKLTPLQFERLSQQIKEGADARQDECGHGVTTPSLAHQGEHLALHHSPAPGLSGGELNNVCHGESLAGFEAPKV